jgi:hypothetical protein
VSAPDPAATFFLVRNPKAVIAFLFALLALAFLAAGIVLPRVRDEIAPLEALIVTPAAFLSALIAIALARRARFDFQRTLGRVGGDGLARVTRVIGVLVLLVSLTAGLAVGVYAVLVLVQG